ncbi:MAG: EAL domain-containing protein [Symploca sp. SIO2C1]|nr:EAL domain-containing protein [Symploca sp. SIO2C1]
MTKVLVIEDEELLRDNLMEILEDEGFQVIDADNGHRGIELAIAEKPDLILCDVMMPGLDGYSVLNILSQDPTMAAIPFIFLTAKATKDDFRQGMELGADDYLTKPFTKPELLKGIASRLGKKTAEQQRYKTLQEFYNIELQHAKEQLNYLSRYDHLTNLPNRLALRELFRQVKSTDIGKKQLITILCLSLDRFNQVKENLGYEFGDLLLKAVAQRIKACISLPDKVVHLDADQFAIILATTQHKKEALTIAQIILDNLSQTFNLSGEEVFITASIGIALYPRDGRLIERLLKNANLAMVQAKRQGGNQYQFYSVAFHIGFSDRLALQTSLRYALEREELEVHYQPIVTLKTGRIVGTEALVRWRHPEKGMILPSKLTAVAEETGLIVPIGEWLFQKACQQVQVWHNSGFESLRLAVNLSGRQFNQMELRQKLVQIIGTIGFNPGYLELELNESILMQNVEVAIRRLNGLKALGIQIAIDDFGTGYSSLGYLQQFPCDILRIDQSFIHNIADKTNQAAITKAIIEMAKNLNLRVIAKGVESPSQLSFIYRHQCDEMQGYLFKRPVQAPEFEELLKSRKRLPLPSTAEWRL